MSRPRNNQLSTYTSRTRDRCSVKNSPPTGPTPNRTCHYRISAVQRILPPRHMKRSPSWICSYLQNRDLMSDHLRVMGRFWLWSHGRLAVLPYPISFLGRNSGNRRYNGIWGHFLQTMSWANHRCFSPSWRRHGQHVWREHGMNTAEASFPCLWRLSCHGRRLELWRLVVLL